MPARIMAAGETKLALNEFGRREAARFRMVAH